jgi:hypothetical protein
MANTAGAFGFVQMGTASGPVNFARAGSPTPYKIKSTYTTAVYFGDAVRFWISGDTGLSALGYVLQWANGDGSATKQLAGIFTGCTYFSTSQKKTIYSNYWPGSDATGDVECYVVDDPNSLWMVQATTGPIDATYLGFGADITATPVGSTTTGFSGMSLATPSAASAATLPFKVVNLVTSPPGVNGTDVTTASNNVIVSFNNQIYKTQTGV